MVQEELLKEAGDWFKLKYGKTPEECGVNFFKVWNKRLLFLKIPTVVFAPSEVEGNAFIIAQGGILRLFESICALVPIGIILFFTGIAYDFLLGGVIIFTGICGVLLIINFWCYKRFKRLEKLYEDKIELYVSGVSKA